MRKLFGIILTIFLSITVAYALPVPDENAEHQPYYMDEHNVLQEKGTEKKEQTPLDLKDTIKPPQEVETSPEVKKNSGTYDENTTKFIYEPMKVNDDKHEEIQEPPDELQVDDSDLYSGAKIDNTNKRTRKAKQLKRKKEDVFMLDPTATEDLPQNNMSSPQQKHYTQDEYEQAYRDMQVPTFSFVHGIDPDQYYDMKDAAWSPYPLFRLNSPLYFKTMVIEPGYYLLTPRQYQSKWYILFKEAGKVKYIIPVFDQSYTEAGYYRTHLPELDMCRTARWHIKFLNSWGKYIRKSKRKPAVQTNIELTDLDNNFLLIELYYAHYKFSTIFRTERF